MAKGMNNSRLLNNIMDGGWGQGFDNVYHNSGDPNSQNILVEGNIIFHAGVLAPYYKPAIQISQGYTTVRRNIIINPQSVAIEESLLYAGTNAYTLVYNNTFYNAGTCLFQSHNINQGGGNGNYAYSVLANNICYPLTGGNATDIYLSDSTQTNTHNDFLYVAGGIPYPNHAIITYDHDGRNALSGQPDCGSATNPNYSCQYPFPVSTADSLSAFPAGYNPPFSNNAPYSVDPLYVSPANFDFHLSSGSPLIGAGTVISDPQWSPPPGTWDIGAYGIP
jgi:hypothetical protein